MAKTKQLSLTARMFTPDGKWEDKVSSWFLFTYLELFG